MLDENQVTYNSQPPRPASLGKWLALGLVIVVFFVAVYWLFTHSFIEITIDGVASPNTSFQLTNQSNLGITTGNSSDTTIKKLVSKSTYEVRVKQGSKSYFAIVNTKGFLSTSNVSARLLPEKNRRFVGDNPGSCMNFINGVLVSYTCSDFYSKVQIHEPATADQPTYSLKNPNNISDGYTEGIIQTKEGALALIQTPVSEEPGQHHYIYFIQNNLSVSRKIQLTSLRDATSYSISSYKDGFIVYDANYQSVYYYPSAESQPQPINVGSPTDTSLSPVSSDFQTNATAVLYSSNEDSALKSTLAVTTNNQTNLYNFNNDYTIVELCGQDNSEACLVGGKGLDVYSLSGGKAKLQLSVRGVIALDHSSAGFLAITSQEVLNLDVTNRQGFADYSLGDYKYNDIQNTPNGYILSLVNNKKAKVALYIDQTATNTDNIDKKVEELQKIPQVTTVSIYGSYIYIVPNLGQLVYDNSTQSLDYDPATQQAATTAINQKIDSLGISRSAYTIINTGE